MALVHKLGWDPQFLARSPWFWPLTRAAKAFERHADWPTPAEYAALYAELALPLGAAPLAFADNVRKQDKRQSGRVVLEELYDARIALRAEVPTRDRNWHDFFNALCFITFPHAKLALHTRQYQVLRARLSEGVSRLPNARTPEQDALTLFDEGGAILATTALGASALAEHTALPARAERLLELQHAGVARVVPFGHALFEHLVEGLRCPGGCTQVVVLPEPPGDDERLLVEADAALAEALRDPTRFVSTRECSHLRLDDVGVGPHPQGRLGSVGGPEM
jgi:Protein of unknown function (DUF3025)